MADRNVAREKMPREMAERLRTALTGGLYVDDFDDYGREYCTIPAAIAHVASAQLRAIRFAIANSEDCGDDEGERSWGTGDKFTKSDAVAAIGGVMALLSESHAIARDIREALDESQPDSDERSGVAWNPLREERRHG